MTSAHTTPIEALLAEQQWLHELARHLVGDPEAALDLEQETWLAALRSPPVHAGSPRGCPGVARDFIDILVDQSKSGDGSSGGVSDAGLAGASGAAASAGASPGRNAVGASGWGSSRSSRGLSIRNFSSSWLSSMVDS